MGFNNIRGSNFNSTVKINPQRLSNTLRSGIWNNKKIIEHRNAVSKIRIDASNTFHIANTNINRRKASYFQKPPLLPTNIRNKITTFIKNATTKEQLTNLQKKMHDPQSSLNKLNFIEKKNTERRIIDRIVTISNNNAQKLHIEKQLKNITTNHDKSEAHPVTNKLKIQQDSYKKQLSSPTTSSTQKVVTFIKNATTKEQLINLQKRMHDPQNPLNKLNFIEKKNTERLIIDRIVTISNNNSQQLHIEKQLKNITTNDDKSEAHPATNKLKIQQDSYKKQLSSPATSSTQKVVTFIKNATTKEQLINLQKNLYNPQKELSKLSKKEKSIIEREINTRMTAIKNIDKVLKFIGNTNNEKQLRNLQKKLDDPQSSLGKFSFQDKGYINRKIIDKMVMSSNIQARRKG